MRKRELQRQLHNANDKIFALNELVARLTPPDKAFCIRFAAVVENKIIQIEVIDCKGEWDGLGHLNFPILYTECVSTKPLADKLIEKLEKEWNG